jgi:hypothetical protein
MEYATSGNPYNQRFTIIPNFLIRKLPVSFEARMMLIYLMSHDEGYLLRVSQIAAESGRCKDTVQRLMRELEEFGVLVRRQLRSAGKITGTVYEIRHDILINRCAENPGDPPTAEDSGPGPEQGKPEFPQVEPETESPAPVESPTKKTITKKTKEEDQKTTEPPAGSPLEGEIVDEASNDRPVTAQTLLATLLDACSSKNVTLTPRVKGMYARKFKELLSGGIPDALILEALRLSWKKKTLDRVQLLDNYLIEVQTGPAEPMFKSASERRVDRADQASDIAKQATRVVVENGFAANDIKALKQALRLIKEGFTNITRMQLEAA